MKNISLLFIFVLHFAYAQNNVDSLHTYTLERHLPDRFSRYIFTDYKSLPTISSIPCVGCDSHAKSADDGKYVMYYKVSEKEDKEISERKPYCYFELRNHKINGKTVYLSPNGDTLAMGNHKVNSQIGAWMVRMPFYKELNSHYIRYSVFSDTITNWATYHFTLKNDSLNGPYSYYENDRLITEGYLEGNRPVGEWRIFHSNGTLANKFNVLKEPLELDRDSMISVNNISENPYQNASHQNYYIYKEVLPYGNENLFFPGLTYDLLYTYSRGNDDLLHNANGIFSLPSNLMFRDPKMFKSSWYFGLFESYYSNGQLRIKIEFDDKGNLLNASDLYNSKGGVEIKYENK